MWCRHCQEDVPGLPARKGGYACPRCGRALAGRSVESSAGNDARGKATATAAAATAEDASEASDEDTAAFFDDWALDGELAHLARLLDVDRAAPPSTNAYQRERARFSAAGAWPLPGDASVGSQSEPANDAAALRSEKASTAGGLAWPALLLGTMAFVCGGALLGWSVVADRSDLWNLGLPIAAGGQIALLVGLVLQLERLWQDHRQSAARLARVDRQLDDLRAATALIGSSHGSTTSPFYTHLAHGAPNDLLLHDLKGQLDLLALRMSQQREQVGR